MYQYIGPFISFIRFCRKATAFDSIQHIHPFLLKCKCVKNICKSKFNNIIHPEYENMAFSRQYKSCKRHVTISMSSHKPGAVALTKVFALMYA